MSWQIADMLLTRNWCYNTTLFQLACQPTDSHCQNSINSNHIFAQKYNISHTPLEDNAKQHNILPQSSIIYDYLIYIFVILCSGLGTTFKFQKTKLVKQQQ